MVGFDNLASTSQYDTSTQSMDTTSYTYDSLNRMASQTDAAGTTSFSYLGTSGQVASESDPGGVSKTYDYTPSGARLSQDTTGGSGPTGYGYYSYNGHSDVEAVTGPSGTTTATYGYTAYGNPVTSMFTGADKNDATSSSSSTTQPYSAYRFNAMRWDGTTGSYDMGFRNYDPGINQFASRDMYDGATADMGLTADPFTGSAYAFGNGNPISNIESDGHMPVPIPDDGGSSNVPPELAALQALQTVYQEKNANAVSGDHTPAHDLVVIDAAIKVLETAKSKNASGTLTLDLEGGDAWKIDSEGDVTETQVPGPHNRIPGGSRKGNGETGEADIMLTQNAGEKDQKVWIWEIKAASKQDEAPEQLKRYIDKTQGGTVGWRLPESPAIPDGKGGFIRAWSEQNSEETQYVGNGIRLYADANRNNNNSNNNSQGQSASQQQQALNQTCGIGLLGLGNCPHAPGGITGDILGFLFGLPGPGTSGPSAPSPIDDPVPVGV